MSTKLKSRWADDENEAALDAQRKLEKDSKKKAKAARQRKLEEVANAQRHESTATNGKDGDGTDTVTEDIERPTKRRRLSSEAAQDRSAKDLPTKLLRFPAPEWGPCRHVDNFEKLNHIEEGSYGWVSRARETATGEIVALKKLKMDNLNDGFPVTGLREIQTLMESRHKNIVHLREVVTGDKMSE